MKKNDLQQKTGAINSKDRASKDRISKDWNEKKSSISGPDFECSAQTHIGYRRSSNQDRYLIKRLADGAVLMALADGLGGDPAGDLAAETVRKMISKIDTIPEGEEKKALEGLTQSLDMEIQDLSQYDPDFGGMGSTLVLALIRNRTVWWFHIGDSRLYLFRNSRLIQITEDQTLDRFLIKENILAPEDAPFHYSRNVMDQFVGCGFCRAASGSFSIGSGDLLALTSDGVYRHLPAPLLAAVLNETITPAAKCREIVTRVLKTGGKDNLTIMIYNQK